MKNVPDNPVSLRSAVNLFELDLTCTATPSLAIVVCFMKETISTIYSGSKTMLDSFTFTYRVKEKNGDNVVFLSVRTLSWDWGLYSRCRSDQELC